ncbi:MAG: T9SS type A sorting domain-containing protein [Bacteroidales bacterium]|jgi:hypothetical protein|nr:T9SS type A sorting domain-containing protein [Bacteroidales bacterium]
MKTFLFFFFILFVFAANAQYTISYETINPVCYNQCNGKIKITGATGGVSPYTLTLVGYSQTITNYNGTDSVYFENLCSGTYTVEISDASQVTIAYQNNIVVSDPPEMTYTVSTTNPTCSGLCNGSAQVVVTNGTPPYHFDLNGQVNNNGIFANLCDGYYYPYISDANGCFLYDATIHIMEPMPLQISFNSQMPSACIATDGMLQANVLDGTPPYTYHWSNGSTMNFLSNIPSGIYHLTVTDINGCSTVGHYALNDLNHEVTLQGVSPTCYGYNNGSVYISYLNTTGLSYNQYINWSDGVTTLLQDTLYNTNSIPDTLYNANANHYFVTITSGPCTLYGYYELTQPDSIKIEAYINDVYCYGQSNGTIYLDVTGGNMGQGYNFEWSNGFSDPYSLYNLAAGNYSVTVSDISNCFNTLNFTINQPDSFIATISPVDISCHGLNDAYILVNPIGGTPPYYYTLDSINSYNYLELTGNTIFIGNAGTYNLFMKDSHYCDTVSFTNITIADPPLMQISSVQLTHPTCLNNDGEIMVNATGGTGSYTYLLNGDTSSNHILNLSEGNYIIGILDDNSCLTDSTIVLTKLSQLPVIKGEIVFNQQPVDSSKTLLFIPGQFGASQWDTLMMSQGSFFNFTDLMPGQYFLKAVYIGESLNVQNTYYNNKLYWTEADTITIGCDDTLYQDINLIQLPTSSGMCSMSGFVRFVSSKLGKAASEPVPGAEITVEQVPGPTIIKMALTDSTGYYEVTNLPDVSNCNLRVDIPGMPLLSTYTGLSVSSSGVASLSNLNFIVDTTTNGGIMKDSTTWANVLNNDIESVNIFPNPFTSFANVEIKLMDNAKISFDIIDITGKKIYTVSETEMFKGNNKLQINRLQVPQSGIYYFVAHSPKTTYVKKFIKQ